MKKGDKKKQQKALKRRAERRQRRKPLPQFGEKLALSYIRQARGYPIEGCWAQKNWEDGGLAVIVVARRQPNGNLVFGSYLVDTYCLGLKDAYCNADIPSGHFHREMLPMMYSAAGQPTKISPDLAHEIIYGGIEYAQQFGFRPHRDFDLAQLVLDPPDAHPRTGRVKFGKDGKPFFVQGPHDNVEAVLRQLDRTVGKGNYLYMFQMDSLPSDWQVVEREQDTSDLLPEAPDAQAQALLDKLGLKAGDSVAVKPGVSDPDTGHDISGWQGRITDIGPGEEDGSVIVTIEWDSPTLNSMPAWLIERCEKEGLDWATMNLDIREVERSMPRDRPEDVVRAKKKIEQQHLTGEAEQDRRIAQVLAEVDPDDEGTALDAWDEYLVQNLTFPFEAEIAEFQEHGPLRAGDRVQVMDISGLDDLYGILVRVRAKRGEYDFPLCDLEVVDHRSPNYQVVDDYAVWFANR